MLYLTKLSFFWDTPYIHKCLDKVAFILVYRVACLFRMSYFCSFLVLILRKTSFFFIKSSFDLVNFIARFMCLPRLPPTPPRLPLEYKGWASILGSGWGGKAEIQGEVLLGDYQLHLHQEDSVMVGEDLVYSLILTPFINSVSCLLCQPPFWGCQSRPKLVPQEAEAAKADGNWCHNSCQSGSCWRGHI